MSAVRSPGADAPAASTLQFRLLGRVEAVRDGERVDIGTRKQRAVLALLLLNANRVVSTERLIDELWGGSPPESARSALQVYIAGLRKALGRDSRILRTTPPGYVLEVERGAVDLERFAELRDEAWAAAGPEQRAALLRDALSLWRDEPLADLVTEPFASAAVPQLEQLRLEALEQRIEADLDLGRHAALIAELEVLVAEHPYRERLRGQLMLALYRSGRQAEALETYREGRSLLSDELGLEPGHDLRGLHAAILRQDKSLRPKSGETSPGDVDGAAPLSPGSGVRDVHQRRRIISPRALLLLGIVLALVAVGMAGVFARGDTSSPVTVPANSVAVIDAASSKVVAALPVPPRPGVIAEGGGALWVGNVEDKTLLRINPRTRRPVKTIALPAAPTGIAFGFGAVWVAHGRSGQLSRVDPRFNRVTKTLDLVGRSLYSPTGSVAAGAGWIWVVFGNSLLVRVHPFAVRESGTTSAGVGPAAIVVNSGSVWVANSGDANVQRFDPTTFQEGPLKTITVGRTPTAMAAGDDAIWVTASADDLVARIDPGANSVSNITVADWPEAVAPGAGALWVANARAATISRIDPKKRKVVEEIALGNPPRGIAVVDGALHVTVQAP
jgi:DNA-binding SARP family transcriptional activator/streptogramin lyase